jgi:hypothetical protein
MFPEVNQLYKSILLAGFSRIHLCLQGLQALTKHLMLALQ